ncbi:polysaccharide biosynthesis protein [Sphingomicrobium arenosum]|uniref:polysaccharide biosynthesis protein n=1 Tax=Sphingomicrobium arenosum TaxID=2233861 RepID=UPI00223EA05E|nr:nucleoside-diphosphate sugar epimerase/dehydratase [Sphingomicrobium arenosum]
MVKRLSNHAVDRFRAYLLNLVALPGAVRLSMVVVADLIACVLATALAYLLRIGEPVTNAGAFILMSALSIFVWSALAYHQRVYRVMMRYFGWASLERLARVTLTMAVVLSCVLVVTAPEDIPRTLGVIQPLVLFVLLVIGRITIAHLLLHADGPAPGARSRSRVLIYGVGPTGRQVASSVRHDPDMRLVGFIDHHDKVGGREVDGGHVWNAVDLEDVLVEQPIDSLFIASRSASRADRLDLVARVHRVLPNCNVKLLPSIADIANDTVRVSDLKPIEIDDLLGREQVAPCPDLMATLGGETVLITGGGGSIGSELCRQVIAQKPARLIIVEMTEYALYAIDQELRETAAKAGIELVIEPCLVDVSDARACADLFARFRPDRVFHAAAYKHVPLMEANIVAGVRNNVFSTLNVVIEAHRNGCAQFTLVSTDKAVRPTNVMGASKRFCELIVQGLAAHHDVPRMSAVRFGNVLGSSGSVVPKFKRQIAEGGPITITHREVTRYFMTIPEAASLVIQSGAMAEGGEVFLLDMGDPVRIGDLAHTMVELAGCTVRNHTNPQGDIEIIETGLRPGEKLYEELLIDATSQPTRHERIVKATEDMVAWEQLELEVERLRRAIADHDEATILAVLERSVAGFGDRAAIKAAQDLAPEQKVA